MVDLAPAVETAAVTGWRPGRRWLALPLPLLLLALWGLAAAMHWGNPALVVPPGTVLAGAAEAVRDGSLPTALLATLVRALAGWALGTAAGLAAGLALGLWQPARQALAPGLDGVRQIALFAWVPLLSAWFGTGEAMKLVLIGLAAFFPVALATQEACRTVPLPWHEVGRLLEFGRVRHLRRIVLPAATPSIAAGMELALTVAWIGTIGAEYLIGTGYMNASANGLGVFLAEAREYARMDHVIAGVVTLALAGLLLDRGFVWLADRLSARRIA